jgi:integrase
MSTNILLALDMRRPKKDGSYPLVMHLGHNRSSTSIPTGVSLHEKDWNAKARKVRDSYVGTMSVTRLNNMLQKKKADAMDIIFKLDEAGKLQALSLADLRSRIAQKEASQSFFKYAEDLIEELKKAGHHGTARSYKGVVAVLRTYNKEKDLSFPQITYSFLTKFETQHLSKGNSYNGLSVYLRAIRAIYNKAMKSGLVEKELYPFTSYKIKSSPTEKRALPGDQIKKIIESDIQPGHPCFDTRNYFLASYMMYGMNYADMAFLKKTDMIDGRISYRRKKTQRLYDIKIMPQLAEILSYYIELNPTSEYIFPILKRDRGDLQEKDIQWSRKRYNKKLKDLATLCGIKQKLTSYVSRHSFATQAMLQEVPLNGISAMLGHSSLKTTEIYLKSLPSNILDDYNEKVMGNAVVK